MTMRRTEANFLPSATPRESAAPWPVSAGYRTQCPASGHGRTCSAAPAGVNPVRIALVPHGINPGADRPGAAHVGSPWSRMASTPVRIDPVGSTRCGIHPWSRMASTPVRIHPVRIDPHGINPGADPPGTGINPGADPPRPATPCSGPAVTRPSCAAQPGRTRHIFPGTLRGIGHTHDHPPPGSSRPCSCPRSPPPPAAGPTTVAGTSGRRPAA